MKRNKTLPNPNYPPFCAARHLETGETIIITNGELGYHEHNGKLTMEQINTAVGATPEIVQAMFAGSMFGWDCPAAKAAKNISQRN